MGASLGKYVVGRLVSVVAVVVMVTAVTWKTGNGSAGV